MLMAVMMRFFHLALMMMTLAGLIGQSSAMATTPMAHASPFDQALNVSMGGMDCAHMLMTPRQDQAPCRKISLHCMAAMGCSPLAMTLSDVRTSDAHSVEPTKTTPRPVVRLAGRSYGPEPDPPSFLI